MVYVAQKFINSFQLFSLKEMCTAVQLRLYPVASVSVASLLPSCGESECSITDIRRKMGLVHSLETSQPHSYATGLETGSSDENITYPSLSLLLSISLTCFVKARQLQLVIKFSPVVLGKTLKCNVTGKSTYFAGQVVSFMSFSNVVVIICHLKSYIDFILPVFRCFAI